MYIITYGIRKAPTIKGYNNNKNNNNLLPVAVGERPQSTKLHA